MQSDSTVSTTICVHCATPLSAHQIGQKYRCCSHQCATSARVKPASERFWGLFDRADIGCWVWRRNHTAAGYGQLRSGGKGEPVLYAHRLSWEIHFGPIPDGLFVCHHCDNPPCVRPDHLFLGTQADNVRDKIAKGRQPRGDAHYSRRTPDRVRRGDLHPLARLTASQVRSIRSEHAAGGITMKALSRRYGVNPSVISVIIARKSWTHVI